MPETIKTTKEDLQKTISDAVESETKAFKEKLSKLEKEKNKALQDRDHFPRTKVKSENAYPNAVLAIAKAKAKREGTGKHWMEYIKEANDKNPSDSFKVAMAYEKAAVSSQLDSDAAGEFDHRVKTLGLGSIADGANLGAVDTQPGFLSELLPNLAFNQLQGVNRVSLRNGQYKFNVEDSGPTGYWGGEAASLTESESEFDLRTLQAKKAHVYVPISNDMLRLNDAGILRDVEASISRKLSKHIDTGYFSGSGNSNQPKGIYNSAATSNAADSSPTATKIKNDVRKLVIGLQDYDVDANFFTFLMTPAMKTALITQYDSDAKLSHYAMQLERDSRLFGYPVITSNNASSDYVALVDASQIYIAEGQGIVLEASSDVAFGSDKTYIKAIGYTDINYAHKTSAGAAKGVGLITATNSSGSDWLTA